MFDPMTKPESLYLYNLILTLTKEVNEIHAVVMSFWKDASDKTLPLPIATWLTNIAYGEIKKLVDTLYSMDPKFVFVEDLMTRYNSTSSNHESSTESTSTLLELGENIIFPHFVIDNWLDNVGFRKIRSPPLEDCWSQVVAPEVPDLEKWILPKSEDGQSRPFREDFLALTTTLMNIYQMTARAGEEAYKNPEEPPLKLLEEYQSRSIHQYRYLLVNRLVDEASNLLQPAAGEPVKLYSFQVDSSTSYLMNRLSIGLSLFLESSRAFLWSHNNLPRRNCRAECLNFAKQVKEINDVELPEDAPFSHKLAKAQEKLYLEDFLSDDQQSMLIYQAPWSAGDQICEVLHRATNTGLWLCRSEGCVQIVLHAYNALLQLGFMDPIPILDDLCQVFLREIFLGALPTSNFTSCFARCVGSSLETKSGKQEQEEDEEQENEKQGKKQRRRPKRKQIPKYILAQTPRQLPKQNQKKKKEDIHQVKLGLARPGAENYSAEFINYKPLGVRANSPLFNQLYIDNYVSVTDDRWIRLLCNKTIQPASQRQINEVTRNLRTEPFSKTLLKIRDAVLNEFTGPVPVARIQYTRIYSLCIDVLVAVGKTYTKDHPFPPEKDIKTDYTLGFALMDIMMNDVLDRRSATEFGSTLMLLPTFQCVRQALQDTFGDKGLADYLWDI